MSRLLKILFSLLGLFFIILLGLGIQMSRMPADQLKESLLSRLNARDDIQVTHLGEMNWQWLPLGVTFTDLDMSHHSQMTSRLQAQRVSVSVKWWPLLKGQLAIRDLNITGWQLLAQPSESSETLALAPSTPASTEAVSPAQMMGLLTQYPWALFETVHIQHGQLHIQHSEEKQYQARAVNITAKQSSNQLQLNIQADYQQAEQWVDWDVTLHITPSKVDYHLLLWGKSKQDNTDLFMDTTLSEQRIQCSELDGHWQAQHVSGQMTIHDWQQQPTLVGHLALSPLHVAPWTFQEVTLDCYQQSPGHSQCPLTLSGDISLSAQLLLDTTLDIPAWQASIQSSDLDMAKLLSPLTGMTLLTGQGQLDSHWSGQGLETHTWQGAGALHIQDAAMTRINLNKLSDLGNPNALTELGEINSQFSFQDLIWTHHQFDCIHPDWRLNGQGTLDFSQGPNQVPMDYQWTATSDRWPADITLSFKNTLKKPKVSLNYQKTLESLLKKQIEKKLKEHVFDLDFN